MVFAKIIVLKNIYIASSCLISSKVRHIRNFCIAFINAQRKRVIISLQRMLRRFSQFFWEWELLRIILIFDSAKVFGMLQKIIYHRSCLYCKKVSIKSLKQAQFEISYFFHFYKICIRKGGFKIFMLIYVKPLWILCSSIFMQVSCKYKTVMLPKTLRFGANFMIFGHFPIFCQFDK